MEKNDFIPLRRGGFGEFVNVIQMAGQGTCPVGWSINCGGSEHWIDGWEYIVVKQTSLFCLLINKKTAASLVSSFVVSCYQLHKSISFKLLSFSLQRKTSFLLLSSHQKSDQLLFATNTIFLSTSQKEKNVSTPDIRSHLLPLLPKMGLLRRIPSQRPHPLQIPNPQGRLLSHPGRVRAGTPLPSPRVPLQPPRRRLELLLVRQDAQHDGPVYRHDDISGARHLRSHLLPVLRKGNYHWTVGRVDEVKNRTRNGFSCFFERPGRAFWVGLNDIVS